MSSDLDSWWARRDPFGILKNLMWIFQFWSFFRLETISNKHESASCPFSIVTQAFYFIFFLWKAQVVPLKKKRKSDVDFSYFGLFSLTLLLNDQWCGRCITNEPRAYTLEAVAEAVTYCGRPCQIADWKEVHRFTSEYFDSN